MVLVTQGISAVLFEMGWNLVVGVIIREVEVRVETRLWLCLISNLLVGFQGIEDGRGYGRVGYLVGCPVVHHGWLKVFVWLLIKLVHTVIVIWKKQVFLRELLIEIKVTVRECILLSSN